MQTGHILDAEEDMIDVSGDLPGVSDTGVITESPRPAEQPWEIEAESDSKVVLWRPDTELAVSLNHGDVVGARISFDIWDSGDGERSPAAWSRDGRVALTATEHGTFAKLYLWDLSFAFPSPRALSLADHFPLRPDLDTP
eukprot:CAMPEP_0198514474 /NCGR_PEP_ID=MMETSP1462-20131121/16712_1 /TAXON_ID=1333877 /ORGANISM="Brandtodinium nutriculum, Strain RCC3387" /LENGTH=139 /DNA_ID=CAMNT_0044243939 /DNA_START=60 /DNA_END=479 /DNA_ORIENTATION=-